MEYIDFFDKVQFHLDSELPFVIFRKPNEDKVQAFLQPTDSLHTGVEFSKAGFLFSPFEESEIDKTVWLYDDECEFCYTNSQNKEEELLLKTHSVSNQAHKNHISRVEKAISKGCG